MKKNGAFFISVTRREQLRPSVWDPFEYRTSPGGKSLKDYVSAYGVKGGKGIGGFSLFRPIEYRDIPEGEYLSFVLRSVLAEDARGYPMVDEQSLLFGTMRAYLGNVLVTPKAEWIGSKSPLAFPVKAEFVGISPHDELPYFWWAYLRSEQFLKALPLGSGGTRPRLHANALLRTPVWVPDLDTRTAIHRDLEDCARQEWEQYVKKARVLQDLNKACRPE